MGKAEDVMGHQHESKPVTDTDKEMSKRHKARRATIDKIDNERERLKESLKYNKAHAKEHMKALKESSKRLSKMGH